MRASSVPLHVRLRQATTPPILTTTGQTPCLALHCQAIACCCSVTWNTSRKELHKQDLAEHSCMHLCHSFISYLTVWVAEPVVTPHTSWLESTGEYGVSITPTLGSPACCVRPQPSYKPHTATQELETKQAEQAPPLTGSQKLQCASCERSKKYPCCNVHHRSSALGCTCCGQMPLGIDRSVGC